VNESNRLLHLANFQFSMETIAVTQDQAKALLAEAKRRAKRTKVEGGYKTYFKRVRGKVPSETHTGSSCAGHRLVRVVCGLRKCAGIEHASMGRVLFKPKTKLARKHPIGVACYMKDFISGDHHAMAHRTRTAPAGFDVNTIAPRRAQLTWNSWHERTRLLREERDEELGNIEWLEGMIEDNEVEINKTILESSYTANINLPKHRAAVLVYITQWRAEIGAYMGEIEQKRAAIVALNARIAAA
jgi:hypothetical protein